MKNGSAAEVAFCKCVLDVEVREKASSLLRIDSTQFGNKMGEHAFDFGYKPSDMHDPAVRRTIESQLHDIMDEKDELLENVVWGGQSGLCTAYVKSRMVVLVDEDHNFVSAFKEIEGGNKRLNNARIAQQSSEH